jgi:hypothetical protein
MEILTYDFKDEDFSQQWFLPAEADQTPLDALDRNPDAENGCDCTLILHADDRIEHRIQVLKMEPHLEMLTGEPMLDGITIHLLVYISGIHIDGRTDHELYMAGREFSVRLKSRHAEMMGLFSARMPPGPPPGKGLLDVWDCDILNDEENDLIIFTFQVDTSRALSVLSWNWSEWKELVAGLGNLIEETNRELRLY